MAEHFENFVDHIMSDDDSELGKVKAERDYALHCLEREIAICAQTQERVEVLEKALEEIAGLDRYYYTDSTKKYDGHLAKIARAALNGDVGSLGSGS